MNELAVKALQTNVKFIITINFEIKIATLEQLVRRAEDTLIIDTFVQK